MVYSSPNLKTTLKSGAGSKPHDVQEALKKKQVLSVWWLTGSVALNARFDGHLKPQPLLYSFIGGCGVGHCFGTVLQTHIGVIMCGVSFWGVLLNTLGHVGLSGFLVLQV